MDSYFVDKRIPKEDFSFFPADLSLLPHMLCLLHSGLEEVWILQRKLSWYQTNIKVPSVE